MPKNEFGKNNAFAGTQVPDDLDIHNEQINSHLMTLRKKEGEQIVAKPLNITDIRPDLAQPRRAIPASIRGNWDGDPNKIESLIDTWMSKVNTQLKSPVHIKSFIEDGGEGVDNHDSPVINEFLDLLALAASIHRDGLANPITVSRDGDTFRIETGERRWLAHNVLKLYVDSLKYAKIPAVIIQSSDVWRQAAENGARRPLNAIGMARQLALLIMDMYRDEHEFEQYESLVEPGQPDRDFYAQVADGNQWRIKRGMSQKILDVTGLKSRSQINQYRNLLSIPDDLWIQADEESWTEFAIRTEVDNRLDKNRSGTNTDMSPVGDISPDYDHDTSPFGNDYGEETPPPDQIDDDDHHAYREDAHGEPSPEYTPPEHTPPAHTPPPPPRSPHLGKPSPVSTQEEILAGERMVPEDLMSFLMFLRSSAASHGDHDMQDIYNTLINMTPRKLRQLKGIHGIQGFSEWLQNVNDRTVNAIEEYFMARLIQYMHDLYQRAVNDE